MYDKKFIKQYYSNSMGLYGLDFNFIEDPSSSYAPLWKKPGLS